MADTFQYFKKMEAAGFTRKQAEAQLEIMTDYTRSSLATRDDVHDIRKDMKDLTAELRQEIKDQGIELRQEINDLAVELRGEIREMGTRIDKLEIELARQADRITIRLGGMMILGFGAMAALIKLA